MSAAVVGVKLTRREVDVLELIVGPACSSNHEAAALGLSPRTVEIHRSRIMRKLAAKNAVHLARMVLLTPEQAA